ncbi:hypothetical protein [Staphylococcus delphini]|uniref:hypothetical protein n=1 Tax=Staphylococcus delphini TaxID=53344 RepID=UPI0021D07B8C|nr:hypothetical protein [Staphylococcus delphini]UXS21718.1 hypothetical protein MUA22_00340 [Staphylococcus delphini]UXS57662.1 hypothetical protein MUA44_00340 [Staphylococcus delphini]
MKKVLMALSSVALLMIIFAAGLFGYKTFIDINNSKEDNKVEKTSKIEDKDKEENNNLEQTTEESTEVVQEQTTLEQPVNEYKELDIHEEIAKADTDGNGVVTTDEMTPELSELYRQGKFQPMSRGMYEANLKYSENSDESVIDDEDSNIDE